MSASPKRVLIALMAAPLLGSLPSLAISPAEIFAQASKSVVVVVAMNQDGKPLSQGSGVVVGNDEVVTNCHVIEGASRTVVGDNTASIEATPIKGDWDKDICVLSVPGLGKPAAVIGSSLSLRIGDPVFAIGSPEGLALTFSDGMVSGLRPIVSPPLIQVSAPISPGSSGGGLFDADAKLIGITTSTWSSGQLLNFAHPVEWVFQLEAWDSVPVHQKNSRMWFIAQYLRCFEAGAWARLAKVGREWIVAYPNDHLGWKTLAMAQWELGILAEAEISYGRASRLNSKDSHTWFSLGAVRFELEKYKAAIEALRKATQLEPENPDYWQTLGSALSMDGEVAGSIGVLEKACSLDPLNSATWYILGFQYLEAGDYDGVITAAERLSELNPPLATRLIDSARRRMRRPIY